MVTKTDISKLQKTYKSASAKTLLDEALGHEEARWNDLAFKADSFRIPTWEDFASLETVMAADMVEDLDTVAQNALKEFDELIVEAGQLQSVEAGLLAFENAMKNVFGDNTERIIRDRLEILVDRGANAAGLESALRDTVSKNNVIDGILNSAKYHTRDHVSKNVMPKIYQITEDVVGGSITNSVGALRELREEINVALSSKDHLVRLTANQGASRGYHYGVMKGGWDAGHRKYVFQAIVDEVTSDTCLHLHNKEFFVADAVDVAERRAKSDPEDIKANAPWFTLDDVDGLDVTALNSIGANLPPLHANCRSSIRFTG